MEAFYPLDVWVCDAVLAGPAAGPHHPRGHLRRVRLLLQLLRRLARPLPRRRHDQIARWGLDASARSSSRSARTTATSSAGSPSKGVPVLGVEPARNIAATAVEAGVPTVAEFFGRELAEQLVADGPPGRPHRRQERAGPDPRRQRRRGGARGRSSRPTGVVTIEFPHLQRLIEGNQFDTIYHEHFSYFSLLSAASDLRAPTACGSSTSRRSGPTADRCGSTPATTATPRSRPTERVDRAARPRDRARLRVAPRPTGRSTSRCGARSDASSRR